MAPHYNIEITAQSFFVEGQSIPSQDRYVFAYTITLRNAGSVAAKLLTRHWIITDANGKAEEVHGDGVVGEHPYLKPGEIFKYSSGAIITTPVGSMRGTYRMLADDGMTFEAIIPAFTLAIPRTLH